MNKWKALLPVVTAFAEGKTVQERNGNRDKWRDIPAGITPAFSMAVENYRVKPEPRVIWVNIYHGEPGEAFYIHTTEADARRNAGVTATTVKFVEEIQ